MFILLRAGKVIEYVGEEEEHLPGIILFSSSFFSFLSSSFSLN
jgi:hypothetical protein